MRNTALQIANIIFLSPHSTQHSHHYRIFLRPLLTPVKHILHIISLMHANHKPHTYDTQTYITYTCMWHQLWHHADNYTRSYLECITRSMDQSFHESTSPIWNELDLKRVRPSTNQTFNVLDLQWIRPSMSQTLNVSDLQWIRSPIYRNVIHIIYSMTRLLLERSYHLNILPWAYGQRRWPSFLD